jgi:hypothetical protein
MASLRKKEEVEEENRMIMMTVMTVMIMKVMKKVKKMRRGISLWSIDIGGWRNGTLSKVMSSL